MKNKPKSPERNSKSASASQPKTSHRKARVHPVGTVTCVFIYPNGREWFRVDFRSDLFALIESCASKLGITLEKFFDLAIRNRIRSLAVRRAA
jgi:hypothetical protein